MLSPVFIFVFQKKVIDSNAAVQWIGIGLIFWISFPRKNILQDCQFEMLAVCHLKVIPESVQLHWTSQNTKLKDQTEKSGPDNQNFK